MRLHQNASEHPRAASNASEPSVTFHNLSEHVWTLQNDSHNLRTSENASMASGTCQNHSEPLERCGTLQNTLQHSWTSENTFINLLQPLRIQCYTSERNRTPRTWDKVPVNLRTIENIRQRLRTFSKLLNLFILYKNTSENLSKVQNVR